MDPTFISTRNWLGWAYTQQGRFSEAIAEFQNAARLSGGITGSEGLGYTYAASGNTVGAKKALEELKQLSKQRYVSPYFMALIYGALGEKDDAIKALEKACEEHAAFVIFMNVDPRLDSVRADPRFQALIRRVGLAP
jgi:tetratricopeptide (TPR) repeat protein